MLLGGLDGGRAPAARRWALAAGLLSGGLLGSWASAHGEGAEIQLRGAVLCLDASSVAVKFVGVSAARQRKASPLRPALHAALVGALRKGRVRHELRASCRQRPAPTRLVVEVRYLDPKNYVGFGDPAYSYVMGLRVGLAGVGGGPLGNSPFFTSSWNDIHSEARTGKSFETALRALGQVQAQDLVRAWQQANP